MSSTSSEELASHSIRANHELIVDLGRAKSAVEQITENSPDVVGLVTLDGRILKGNTSCATLFGCDDEQIYERGLKQAFTGESWRTVNNKLVSMGAVSETSTSFELPVDGIDPDRLFHWTFSPFTAVSERRGKVFSFVGKDITALRNYERKLAAIFSALPLGVLTLDRDGKIEWPWSQFSETLLGNNKLQGLDARTGIFGRAGDFLTKTQKEGAKLFFDNIGGEELWYEMAKDQFPKEVPIASADGQEIAIWLGINYNPIVRDGNVDKVLVVVDDITERVRLRKELAEKSSREQRTAQTLVELQEADPMLLSTCVEDIDVYLDEIRRIEPNENNARVICNSLHGIKGVSRAVNLVAFKELIHDTESKILKQLNENSSGLKDGMVADLKRIRIEWLELRPFIEAFRARITADSGNDVASEKEVGKDLRKSIIAKIEAARRDPKSSSAIDYLNAIESDFCAMFQIPFKTLQPKIDSFFAQTRRKLGRKASLTFELNDAKVDRDVAPMACEIFYHLLTNALDHAIESPDQREAAGKDPEGQIVITARVDGRMVHFTVQDDGKGFDTEKLRAKAEKMGTVKPGQILSEKEIWHLALLSEMSTAEKVTDTSGRGIGLSAVDERVKRLGGDGLIIADSVKGKGTRFEFTIKN
jgi:PAS domain S-box-containing protein